MERPPIPAVHPRHPPGLHENGGPYSHAAPWAILGRRQAGAGDTAAALFALLDPITHARNPVETGRCTVAPYAAAAAGRITGPPSRASWASVSVGSTRYDIRVDAAPHGARDAARTVPDGSRLDRADGVVRLPLDGGTHTLRMVLPPPTGRGAPLRQDAGYRE